MIHRFQRNNNIINVWAWITCWELIIILDDIGPDMRLAYTIKYDHSFKYYHIHINKEDTHNKYNLIVSYKHKYAPEIIQYLVSNNICTIDNTYDTYYNLVFTNHILLELI